MTSKPSSSRSRQFAVACAGIAAYGVSFACLGVAFGATDLRHRLGASLASQGALFFVLYAGVFVSNVMVGRLTLLLGRKPLLLSAISLIVVSLASFGTLQSLPLAYCSAFVLGWGGGATNVAVNALVSDLYPESRGPRLNLLGVFFGFGAVCTPLLAVAAHQLTVPVFFAMALVLPLLAFGLTASTLLIPSQAITKAGIGIGRLDGVRGELAAIAAILFFENGNEAVTAGWTSTMLLARGYDHRLATAALTTYWLSLMSGRLIASRLPTTINRRLLLAGCALGGLCGAIGLAFSQRSSSIFLSLFCLGLCSAPIFKTALSMAGDLHPHAAYRLYGPLFALSLIAASAEPWIAGRIAEASSPIHVPMLMVTGLVVVGAITLLLSRQNHAPRI